MALTDFFSPTYWCKKNPQAKILGGKIVRVEQNPSPQGWESKTQTPDSYTAASNTNFLLYFRTPRSTLKDIEVPSSSGKKITFFLPLSIISLLKKTPPAPCQRHFPRLCGCPLSSPRLQEQDEGTCRVHCVPVSEPKHNPAFCSQPPPKVIQQEEVKAPRRIWLRHRAVCFN